MHSTYKIRFEGISVAEAGQKVEELRRDLKEASEDVESTISRDDPSNQDFGATLVLVLGTPAVIAIANGISKYLARAGGKITIEADGKIVAENISGGDVARIEEALRSKNREQHGTRRP